MKLTQSFVLASLSLAAAPGLVAAAPVGSPEPDSNPTSPRLRAARGPLLARLRRSNGMHARQLDGLGLGSLLGGATGSQGGLVGGLLGSLPIVGGQAQQAGTAVTGAVNTGTGLVNSGTGGALPNAGLANGALTGVQGILGNAQLVNGLSAGGLTGLSTGGLPTAALTNGLATTAPNGLSLAQVAEMANAQGQDPLAALASLYGDNPAVAQAIVYAEQLATHAAQEEAQRELAAYETTLGATTAPVVGPARTAMDVTETAQAVTPPSVGLNSNVNVPVVPSPPTVVHAGGYIIPVTPPPAYEAPSVTPPTPPTTASEAIHDPQAAAYALAAAAQGSGLDPLHYLAPPLGSVRGALPNAFIASVRASASSSAIAVDPTGVMSRADPVAVYATPSASVAPSAISPAMSSGMKRVARAEATMVATSTSSAVDAMPTETEMASDGEDEFVSADEGSSEDGEGTASVAGSEDEDL